MACLNKEMPRVGLAGFDHLMVTIIAPKFGAFGRLIWFFHFIFLYKIVRLHQSSTTPTLWKEYEGMDLKIYFLIPFHRLMVYQHAS
jgi:hypothetical protein